MQMSHLQSIISKKINQIYTRTSSTGYSTDEEFGRLYGFSTISSISSYVWILFTHFSQSGTLAIAIISFDTPFLFREWLYSLKDS